MEVPCKFVPFTKTLDHRKPDPGCPPVSYVRSDPGRFVMPNHLGEQIGKIYNMEVKKDDVWVVTPPKCGTTWMQELVWCVMNKVDLEKAKSVVQGYRFPYIEYGLHLDKDLPGKSVDISTLEKTPENARIFMENSFSYASSLPSPRMIKSHMPFSLLPPSLPNTAKVVYVARNIKDVCVSSYYHNQQTVQFKRYAEAFKSGEVMIGEWIGHMEEANNLGDKICFIWYEDMKQDIRSVIRTVAKFLEQMLTDEEVEKLANHLDIDTFRENKSVNKRAVMNDKWNPQFIRKGVVGDWKNHFTPETSKEWDEWIKEELDRTGLNMRGWK